MRVARALRFATVFAFASFALEAHAAGDDKQECVAASEKAQQLRNAGKLSEAREQLVICGREVCPKLVQQDCTQWMSDLIGVLPTVVPGAKDKKGHDLVDVKVSVDGKVVTETLDGKPLPVDPGVHTFRFEAKGMPPVEEKLVVRQGEKNRIMMVALGEETPAPAEKPVAAVGDAKPGDRGVERREGRSFPIVPVVLGALGLVAGGVALYIDLDANADARRLRDECAPKCNPADVDDIDRRRVIAAVTAAAGGALIVSAVVLYFVSGGSGAHGQSRAPIFAAAPLPGGAAATAMVHF